MTAIADSDAFREADRILPQHQAALTLLQSRLSDPGISRIRWLDLACGRGQIITTLNENLSSEARVRLEYWGYDINQAFARETRRTAEQTGFGAFEVKIGALSDFHRVLPDNLRFDFISLTNTIHEVAPSQLAGILINSVVRLESSGTLFAYDMERIRPPELGAIPWERDEIRSVVRKMLDALTSCGYQPEVGRWVHRSCTAWNVQLQRQHLGVSDAEILSRYRQALVDTQDEIARLMRIKLELCRRTLDTLTLCGAETAEEQDEKQRLLYEFWALSRALEGSR